MEKLSLLADTRLPVSIGHAMSILANLDAVAQLGLNEQTYWLEVPLRSTANHGIVIEADRFALKELLIASWNMEYSILKAEMMLQDEMPMNALRTVVTTLQHGLRQSLRAFLYTQGVRGLEVSIMSREIGRLIVKGYYPPVIGFYCAGPYEAPTVHRTSSSHLPHIEQAKSLIRVLLPSTRKELYEQKAIDLQMDVQNCIMDRNAACVPLMEFDESHWQQLTWRLGYTTIWDLLLVAKRAICEHQDDDLYFDPVPFFNTCASLYRSISAIHERYVQAFLASSPEDYDSFVNQLPDHLKQMVARA